MNSEKKQIEVISKNIKQNIIDFLQSLFYLDFKKSNIEYSVWIPLLFTFVITITTGLFNIVSYLYNKEIFDLYGISIELYIKNAPSFFSNFLYNAFAIFLLLLSTSVINIFKSDKNGFFAKIWNFFPIALVLFPITTIVAYQIKNSLTNIFQLYLTLYFGIAMLYFFIIIINAIWDFADKLFSKKKVQKNNINKILKQRIVSILLIMTTAIILIINSGQTRYKAKLEYYIINSNKVVAYTLSDKYIVLDAKIEGETITIKRNTSTVINIEDKTTTFKKFKKVLFENN